jgi:hypothetical protein
MNSVFWNQIGKNIDSLNDSLTKMHTQRKEDEFTQSVLKAMQPTQREVETPVQLSQEQAPMRNVPITTPATSLFPKTQAPAISPEAQTAISQPIFGSRKETQTIPGMSVSQALQSIAKSNPELMGTQGFQQRLGAEQLFAPKYSEEDTTKNLIQTDAFGNRNVVSKGIPKKPVGQSEFDAFRGKYPDTPEGQAQAAEDFKTLSNRQQTFDQTVVDKNGVPVITTTPDGGTFITTQKIDASTKQPIPGTQEKKPYTKPIPGIPKLPNINYDLSGDEFIKDLSKKDPDLARFVKLVGDNVVPITETPTRNFRGGKGYLQSEISPLVQRYKDTWDETQFPAMKNYKKSFESGAEKIRIGKVNTALTHMEEVKKAGDMIDKKLTDKGGWFTKSYNTLGAWLADNSGSPEVTAFNTAAERVADELAAFYKGGNASATDVGQEKERILNTIKNAPVQKGAFVNTTMALLSGAVATIRDGYKSAMGKEPEPNKVIYPTARKALKNLEKLGVKIDWDKIDPSSSPQTGTTQQTGQTNAKGWALHVDAQGNKAYVSPDGKQFEEVR